MTPRTKAILVLFSGAALISFSPAMVKLAAERMLGPSAIGFWRTLIGGLILFAIAIARGNQLRLSKRAFRFAALAGFFFFVDLFFWHRSVVDAGSGMATILANTQVFTTAILSFLIFKEKLTIRFFLSALAAFVGLALLVGLVGADVEITTRYVRGVIYGLITGLAYANYIVTLKKGRMDRSHPDAVVLVAWVSIFSALFLGVAASVESGAFLPVNLVGALALLGLALLVQALGWWAISNALPNVPTPQAGLALLLQPTLAMVWGVLFFAEYLAPSQMVGAVITLAAIYAGGLRE